MTTAASTYTWATYSVALKAYLGVSGSTEDTNLQLWLESAAVDCDDFVGEDAFTDDDGDPIAHPSKIKLGIFEWVKAYRARAQRGAGPGVTSVRTGSLAETYSNDGTPDAGALARAAARDLWMASVKDVSLLGAAT